MLKKRFFNKSNAEKPENSVPDNKDENTVDGIEETTEKVLNEEDAGQEPSEPDAEPETEETPEELNDELTTLKKGLSESQDKYLRLVAEFDNYRKRTLREKAELIQTAGESLLIDILPVMDDFERGIQQAAQTEDMDSVRTGMGLIYSKLKDFLNSHGVKEINAMNEPFDTDWHEAVTNIPAPTDEMKGKILDVIQKGYTLYDKVMRYSKVVVGE